MMTRRDGLGAMAAGLAAAPLAAAAGQPATDSDAPVARFVFEAEVDIASTEKLGQGPLGERRIVPILGGRFAGPRLAGKVRPGGADRQVMRADGVLVLEALYELETDDGVVLTVFNRALIDRPKDGPVYAASTPVITAPDGRYGWLNRRVFAGTIAPIAGRQAVRIRVFELG